MKKHITIIASIMLAFAMSFSACNKDPQGGEGNGNGGNNQETSVKRNVRYKLDNEVLSQVISPCFKANINYVGADGQMVEVKNAELPWSVDILVEAPFHAKFEGTMVYDESELPDDVSFGTPYGIFFKAPEDQVYSGESLGHISVISKDKFLEFIETNPDFLQFQQELNIR